jgi:hypothetical protein
VFYVDDLGEEYNYSQYYVSQHEFVFNNTPRLLSWNEYISMQRIGALLVLVHRFSVGTLLISCCSILTSIIGSCL